MKSIARTLALGFADQGASIAVHYSADADANLGLPDAARATGDELRSRGVEACLVEIDPPLIDNVLPKWSDKQMVRQINSKATQATGLCSTLGTLLGQA